MLRQLRAQVLKPKQFGSEVLSLYLKHAIHLVLWGRRVYPHDCFEEILALETFVWWCPAPIVVTYIEEAINSLKEALSAQLIDSVQVVIYRKTQQGVSTEIVCFQITDVLPELNCHLYLETCGSNMGKSLSTLRRNIPFAGVLPTNTDYESVRWVVRSQTRHLLRPTSFKLRTEAEKDEAEAVVQLAETSIPTIQRFLTQWVPQEGPATDPGALVAYLRWPGLSLETTQCEYHDTICRIGFITESRAG